MKAKDPRARIPSINALAERIGQVLSDWELGHEPRVRLARWIAEDLRTNPGVCLDDTRIQALCARLLSPGPRPVINATGILLHTNLGRAPLRQETVVDALAAVAGYTDLEWDRDSGKRGHRDRHFANLAKAVWHVEDAMLVNNAAAAVALCLAAIAAGGETIVSRGELIEIGGSFRLPDIMDLSGTHLVEVGATNKTKPDDYRRAMNQNTKCLFKSHTSNYRIEGFTADVDLPSLVGIGAEKNVPVIMDLGSGLPRDLPFPEMNEPTIEGYINAGPDLLIFSGDKLFGGVQAGIILGKAKLLQQIRSHPMTRMVRCDKFTIALVCHQLRDTVLGRVHPFAQLAITEPKVLRQRAETIVNACAGWQIEIIEEQGYVGGGSLPREQRPGIALRLPVKRAESLAEAMRDNQPAIAGHLHRGGLHLNLAAVFPEQDAILIDALNGLNPKHYQS